MFFIFLRYAGGEKSFLEIIRDTPFYLKRICRFLTTAAGIGFLIRTILFSKMIIVLIFYILSPFDLLPEAILGVVGLLDDIIALAILVIVVSNAYR